MIAVQNLCKKYGDRTAIENISFSVKKGEALGFLGPNGAGKTTTMKIIAGCLAPLEGSVKINNKDILDDPLAAKSKIGYLPEVPPLYVDMYVKNYLFYVGRIKRCPPGQLSDLVHSAMQKTGLLNVKNRLIYNLSKGFKQRVGLAQALVSNPDLLILDEPTVGLDPVQVIEIRALIKELKRDHTIILSTHILSEVEANCSRIIIINQGKTAQEGMLKDLRQKAKTDLQVRVKNPSAEIKNHLESMDGVQQVRSVEGGWLISIEKEINEEIAQLLIQKKAGLMEMSEKGQKLEDIFIRTTQKKEEEF